MARTAGGVGWSHPESKIRPFKETSLMAVARGYGQSGRSIYANITNLKSCTLNFTIDSTNGNGLGIRSLKSNGYVESVYMNTSAAFTGTSHTSTLIDGIASGTSSLVVGMPVQGSGIPANTTIASIVSSGSITLSAATTSSTTGSITYQGKGSPNPGAGFAQIKFKNNFVYYLGGFSGFVSTVSGSALKIDNSALTAGQAYTITTLGNSTLANWQSIGFPVGFVPAVGSNFIATAVGVPGEANTSTSRVMTPKASGILCVEAMGDATQTLNNSSIAANAGAIVIVQFLAPTLSTNAYGQPMIPTAPQNSSVCGMTFWFDGSTVQVPDAPGQTGI